MITSGSSTRLIILFARRPTGLTHQHPPRQLPDERDEGAAIATLGGQDLHPLDRTSFLDAPW